MKKKLFLFIAFAVLGLLQAILFMFTHASALAPYSFAQRLLALIYSIPQSVMVAAWVMVPIFFVGLVYVFIRGDWHRKFMIRYVTLIAMPITYLCIFDWVLYDYWGFRLDATPFVYLFDSPLETIRQSPWWATPLGIIVLLVVGWLTYQIMESVYPKRRSGSITRMSTGSAQQFEALYNLLLTILMVIVGSGCFGLMGISSSYFTDQQPLNHAATHPVYSLFHSINKHCDPLDEQYQFLTEEERTAAMDEMRELAAQEPMRLLADSGWNDSLQIAPASILRKGITPNVLLLMLEGFGGSACSYLNPDADAQVMPNVSRLMGEGIAFNNFYANGIRTERGISAVLASWPSLPTYSVMLDAERCRSLHYMTQPLASAGYTLEFLYGGDGTYCQLPNFLQSAGIEVQNDRRSFPDEMHDFDTGVQDAHLYDCLYELLKAEALAATDTMAEYPAQPYFKFVPTLSSHEPFEVPYHHFDDPYLNAVAYADSCLGAFVSRIKADTTIWNNLLIVALADHAYANYPEDIQQCDPERYHIPMFWTGGAVAQHRDVNICCQQTDLTVTLLHQLGIQPEAGLFPYSHDIFQPTAPHFAFYAWPDGFGMLTDSCTYIQDNYYDGHPLPGSDDPTGRAQRLGKAYLQTVGRH